MILPLEADGSMVVIGSTRAERGDKRILLEREYMP